MGRHILGFLLILTLLRNLCDAQCSVKPVGKKGCFQNGKWYRAPAVWKTNNCQRCECKPKELICCSLVFRPINYDKEKCIAMFHRQSCSIRVVRKNDPSKSCHVFAGVG
ncbi:beta-microseminoprotein [Erythrolamprus reginae]|uniref:beta-microseminoprotein n=1 Tax=Erythrolamprus reginae TaxID=121349 RepID=UPI00396CFF3C